MQILKTVKVLLCIFAIALICLIAASALNENLLEKLKNAGEDAISALSEFSRKAESNTFSEASGD